MNKTQEVQKLIDHLKKEGGTHNEELLLWEIDKLDLAINQYKSSIKQLSLDVLNAKAK